MEITGQRAVVTLRNASTLTASDRHFVVGLGNVEVGREEFRPLLMAHRSGRIVNARLRSATGMDTLAASQLLRDLRDRDLLTLHAHGAASYYTFSEALRADIEGSCPTMYGVRLIAWAPGRARGDCVLCLKRFAR